LPVLHFHQRLPALSFAPAQEKTKSEFWKMQDGIKAICPII
jgi:hypothetical protein